MGDDLTDQWHIAVCRELESRVKNRDFWLWVTVEPGDGAASPDDSTSEDWRAVADDVAGWLGGISADSVDPDSLPTHEARIAATSVELTANPKKPNRRGTDPLVLNLYPGMTYFQGAYSAGPAPELPDDPDPPPEDPEPPADDPVPPADDPEPPKDD
jgi:hypothetical protein